VEPPTVSPFFLAFSTSARAISGVKSDFVIVRGISWGMRSVDGIGSVDGVGSVDSTRSRSRAAWVEVSDFLVQASCKHKDTNKVAINNCFI
jgi:hypothetical protein